MFALVILDFIGLVASFSSCSSTTGVWNPFILPSTCCSLDFCALNCSYGFSFYSSLPSFFVATLIACCFSLHAMGCVAGLSDGSFYKNMFLNLLYCFCVNLS